MSANVESLFYVDQQTTYDEHGNKVVSRFVPWHGLGTPVSIAPNSKDAITLAGLDWTVDSKPIYNEKGQVINGFAANTRSSDDFVLGIVSSRYDIVQNSDAFDFTDALIGDGAVYETAGALDSGRRVWLLARMPEQKVLGEKFDPYLCFTNNHDGKGAVKVCVTPIRVVCQNTLNLALSTASRNWSTKHVGDFKMKAFEAKKTLGLYTDYMKSLDEVADEYANYKLSDDEIMAIFDLMYPIDEKRDSLRRITGVNNIRNNFVKCLQMPDVTPYRNTAYAAILAATDQADHYTFNRVTQTYQLNNFGAILSGHPYVDNWVKAINKRMGK